MTKSDSNAIVTIETLHHQCKAILRHTITEKKQKCENKQNYTKSCVQPMLFSIVLKYIKKKTTNKRNPLFTKTSKAEIHCRANTGAEAQANGVCVLW